jgi:type IX secretion system PorP/SprF family membrane protein
MRERIVSKYISRILKGMVCFLLAAASMPTLAQQKVQFTQYMFNGLILNPAYAGTEEMLSITAMHRMQWTGIEGAPVTQTLSAHTLFPGKHMGIGISFVNDKIGVHKNLSAMASYAYHLPVGKTSWLSFGVQAGLHDQKSDYGSLGAASGNDPLVATSTLSESSFDVGTGIYFRSKKLQVGLSAPELLPESLAVNDSSMMQWEKKNYFLFTKYSFRVSDKIDLEPGFLLKYFGATPLSADLNLNTVFYKVITFGVSYRMDESVDVMLSAKVTPQFRFGYAYDYGIGAVPKVGSGSHEIMLNYRFQYEYSQVDSPR